MLDPRVEDNAEKIKKLEKRIQDLEMLVEAHHRKAVDRRLRKCSKGYSDYGGHCPEKSLDKHCFIDGKICEMVKNEREYRKH